MLSIDSCVYCSQVSLIFINFGCAMDWPTVKGVIKRPVGPIIGMVAQFLFMPLVSSILNLIGTCNGTNEPSVSFASIFVKCDHKYG